MSIDGHPLSFTGRQYQFSLSAEGQGVSYNGPLKKILISKDSFFRSNKKESVPGGVIYLS
jgi:hypothetical protein